MTTTSHERPTDEQLIRRGRGEAFDALQRDPSLADIVLDSALVDDRWDAQVETRDDYLARLLIQVDADPAPLVGRLLRLLRPGATITENGVDLGLDLAADVLVRLAVRGEPRAVAGLRAGLAEAGPESAGWISLVELLAWSPAALGGDLPALARPKLRGGLGRLTNSELQTEPWRSWMRRGATPPAGAEEGATRVFWAAPPPDPGVGDDQLLADIRQRGPRSRPSLRELGRRGRVELLLSLAADTSLRHPQLGTLPGLGAALREASHGSRRGGVLAGVRAWVRGEDEYLRAEGVSVLADLGEAGDVPALIRGWDEAVGDGAWCQAEVVSRAFGRLGVTEAVPRLLAAYDLTPHSYARSDFLRALADLDVAAAEPLLAAALLDAEPDQRNLAAEQAPLTASALATLRELADDVHEDDAVRSAAAKRLGRPDLTTAPSRREV